MSGRSNTFLIGLPVLVVTIIAAFVAISFVTHDPHWPNRGGAVVAACSAGAIFFQIRSEIDIERQKHELELKIHSQRDTKGPASDPVLDELERRLTENRIKHQGSELTRKRLEIAAIVVMGALVGELLHGFGDLVLEVLFADYFDH